MKTILKKFGIQDFVILISVIPILSLQLFDFASDAGVGWHLSTGKLISSLGRVPRTDPFLYSFSQRDWISDQWLSDLILYNLYSIGSWPLLYVTLFLVYLGAYFAILFPAVAKSSKCWIASSLFCFLAMRGGLIHFVLRPVIFGQLMFCSVFALISLFRAGRLSQKLLFFFCPILFMVWANLHPSFSLGLILVFCLVLESLYKSVWLKSPKRDLRITSEQGCLLFLVCLFATVINPYGLELHKSILWLANNKFFLSYHSEWHSPDFKSGEGQIFQIFLLVLCVAPFLRKSKPTGDSIESRFDQFDALTLLAFAHLSLEMVRVLPHFFVVATLPAAKALQQIGRGLSERAPERLKGFLRLISNTELHESKSMLGFVTFLALSGFLISWSVIFHRIPYYDGEYGPSTTLRAKRAIEKLSSLVGSKEVPPAVLASPDLGGAITFFGEQKILPVIDDRNTLLGEAPYKRFNQVMSEAAIKTENVIVYGRSLGAKYLLLKKDDPIVVNFLEGHFQSVVEADGFIVFALAN